MAQLLTSEQVANQLVIDERGVWAAVAAGEIATVRLGEAIRFRPSDVAKFVASTIRVCNIGREEVANV